MIRSVLRKIKAAVPWSWRYRWRLRKLRRALRTESGAANHDARGASASNEQAQAASTVDLEALRFPPGTAASAEDITACYRLFLERAPDPDGLAAYTDAVVRGGLDLAGLVESFRRSAEFRDRLTARAEDRACKIAELEFFRMYVMPGDWSVGKSILATGAMEPHVTAALTRLLQPGMTFVDVGANIGYFTMLGARLVGPGGRVIAFEAAPQNCSLIYASAALNQFKNIRIDAIAVAERGGPYLYQSSGSNGRIVPFDAARPDALRGDFLWAGTLEERLADGPAVDVIKIDIEGAEYRALLGAGGILERHRPVLLSEFSPPQLAEVSGVSGPAYLELILEAGYEIAVLEEAGAVVECGGDMDRVLALYDRSAKGLLDLICTPV
ncbi:MAG: FkbM family methyltransferase [Leptospirales bacterium]